MSGTAAVMMRRLLLAGRGLGKCEGRSSSPIGEEKGTCYSSGTFAIEAAENIGVCAALCCEVSVIASSSQGMIKIYP